MVKFYAPWCGHCQALKPKYIDFEKLMKDEKRLTVAEVDCTSNGDLCTKEGVKGYPTVKLYKDGDVKEDYMGNRSPEDFEAFVKKHLN